MLRRGGHDVAFSISIPRIFLSLVGENTKLFRSFTFRRAEFALSRKLNVLP